MRLQAQAADVAKSVHAVQSQGIMSSKGGAVTPSAVVGIRGVPVDPTPPVAGQALVYDGTAYVPGAPTGSGAQYRQFTWAIDGAGDWDFLSVDDGTGQMVPVTALFDLE